MGKLRTSFYHLAAGFMNAIAAAAFIYVSGFLELIGSVDQIIYVIAGMVAGIVVFTFLGILITRLMDKVSSWSLVVFAVSALAFFVLNPADRVVENLMMLALSILSFGVLALSTSVFSGLFLINNIRRHPIANGLIISGWAVAFSLIILSVYQYFYDSHFSLITVAGEGALTVFSIIIFLRILLGRSESPRHEGA